MAEKEEERVIDIDALMWDGIKQAAKESSWMPKEYVMNDWVSDVERFLRDGGLFQTNVHLIASAPDLLTALQDMVEIGYTHEDGCHPSEGICTEGCFEKQAVLIQSRAAIAKAEGRE